MPESKSNRSVELRKNNIYLSADICRTYFSGIETVIVIKEREDIVMMPIQGSMYGGLMLKLMNRNGDRVVSVYDFLKHHGLLDMEGTFRCSWNKDKMGLSIHLQSEGIEEN